MTSLAHEKAEPLRWKDLIRLLDLTRQQYEQLGEVIRSKISFMGIADIESMRRLMDEELALAQRLQEREGLRKQLMDAIGMELGLTPKEARSLPVSKLSERVGKESGEALIRAADGLREAVARVAQANRVAAIATRELWNHLRWVMESVRAGGGPPVGYSAGGCLVSSDGITMFEAIG